MVCSYFSLVKGIGLTNLIKPTCRAIALLKRHQAIDEGDVLEDSDNPGHFKQAPQT